MKAIIIDNHGSIDVLKIKDIDEPVCHPDQIKVNIKASSINHLDIWVRNGIPGMNIPLPMILGSDGAGIIVETGNNIKDIRVGDKVVVILDEWDDNFIGEITESNNAIDYKEQRYTIYFVKGDT